MVYGYFYSDLDVNSPNHIKLVALPIKLSSTNSKKEQIKLSILNLKCSMVSHNYMAIAVIKNKLAHSDVT